MHWSISTLNGNCKNGYQKASKTINKSLSRLFLCTQRGESKDRGRNRRASFLSRQHSLQPRATNRPPHPGMSAKGKKAHTRTFTHTRTRGIRLFSRLSLAGERERAWGQEECAAAHYRRGRERGENAVPNMRGSPPRTTTCLLAARLCLVD